MRARRASERCPRAPAAGIGPEASPEGERAPPRNAARAARLGAHENVRRYAVAIHRTQLDLALEVADDGGADIYVVELVDVVDAPGGVDVDLEDLVTHEVDPHEVEAVSRETRAQEAADALLGFGEFGATARAPHGHVVAKSGPRAHALWSWCQCAARHGV